MKKYKHILFDLDQTLWDFETNCSETIIELFEFYDLYNLSSVDCNTFIKTYKEVNKEMWQLYHKGLVSKDILRSKRFELTFQKLGVSSSVIPLNLNSDYLKICPTKSALVPYALELLKYLFSKYSLHILTNGFKEIQEIKISNAKINIFFKEVIHFERCGFLKPDKRFFNYSLNAIKADPSECLMVGDDLEADVIGAKNAGIDQAYFNPEKCRHKESVTLEIRSLSELISIL